MKTKALLLALAVGVLCSRSSHAQSPPGGGGSSNPWLNSWTFSNTNWLASDGVGPLSYTNLVLDNIGDGGASVLIDSTNTAYLRYAVIETNGNTNLIISGDGSVSFWFNPSWSSDDQLDGSGPSGWGRLFEIGAYTTNAASGWWSLFLSPDGQNIYFSAEDTNGVATNYLIAPISWTAGSWHQLVLTYSLTNNTALFCDGVLLTNGNPLTILPGPTAISNGFFLGSDATGSPTNQAHGAFDDLYTSSTAFDTNYVRGLYGIFALPLFGVTNFASSAPSDSVLPTETNTFLAVTGPGYLQWAGAASNVTTGGQIYITNAAAGLASNFSMTFSFSIGGGTNGVPYDVFGTTALTSGGVASNSQWYWLGQGYTSNKYILTNQPSMTAFYVLGTPKDSDGDGLSDAYERLVSHTDPNNPDTSYSGLGDGWYVAYGLNPLAPTGVPNMRLGYWRFNTNSWIGEENQLPTLAANLALVPSWSSNAVQVDSGSSAHLRYADFNPQYGMDNINCRSGTVRFWINPDWNSGSGPGATAQLVEMGDGTSSGGYWSFSASADGTKLFFQTATNGVTTTYFTNTISWTSNNWHQLALTYAPGTNGATILYVDGAQAASGPAITGWPSAVARATNGLNLGSSRTGSGQSRAIFDELETFNYPLSSADIANDYGAVAQLNPVPIISFTNFYVATSTTMAMLSGDAGAMAVLVDSTNFASAPWTIYSTNVTINLGSIEGWHDVWIGLSAISSNTLPIWQRSRLKLDFTPPALSITNPITNTTWLPTIQLQGFSVEPLYSLTFDLTNAAGVITNQSGAILRKYLDTNIFDFTTNWFQCFDIDLTNGVNLITLHAADLAGNKTNLQLSITLNLSLDTNAPSLTLYWPTNGAQLSGSSFTLRGMLNNPTAQVVAQIVDTNGVTNTANGEVERDGTLWIDNLPLTAGTNWLSVTMTDAATNSAITNIVLIGSSLQLSIDPVPDGTITSTFTSVTGEINSTNYTVWVNGIQAGLNGGGYWTASNVPLNDGGQAVIQARAIPNSDNGGNGSTNTGSGNPSVSNPGNPNSSGAIDSTIQPEIGPYFRVKQYQYFSKLDFYELYAGGPLFAQGTDTETVQWTTNGGSDIVTGLTIDENPTEIFNYNPFSVITYGKDTYPPTAPGDYIVYYDPFGYYDPEETIIGPIALPWQNLDFAETIVFPLFPHNFTWLPPWAYQTNIYTYLSKTQLEIVVPGRGTAHNKRLIAATNNWQVPWDAPVLGFPPYSSLDPSGTTVGSLGTFAADGLLITNLEANTVRDATETRTSTNNYQYQATPEAPKLVITANGYPLSGNTIAPGANFCVGQGVTFSAYLSSALLAPQSNAFQWSFTGNYFNDRTNTVPNLNFPDCSRTPYVNSNLLTFQSVTNWWISGGYTPPLTYTATLSGTLYFTNGRAPVKITNSGLFTVARPNAKINPVTGSVAIWTNGGSHWLSFRYGTNGISTSNGITFYHTVDLPTGFSGSNYWVQVVTSATRTAMESNGLWHSVLFPPTPFIDAVPQLVIPYGSFDFTGTNAVDSPGQDLGVFSSKYGSVICSNTFSMCLLFTPSLPNARAVPLRFVNWGWRGSATNNGSGWLLLQGTNSVNPSDFDATQYPQWIENANHLTNWTPSL